MSTQLVDNFSLSAKKFLDNRQSWTSLDELQANTNVLMPNGFLAYCRAENKWYIMSCENENDPSTYQWSEYTIGNGTEGNVVQVATLPVANAENKNRILQYVGKDDTNLGLVKGYWYKCTMLLINDEITYKWLPINVQHNNGIDVFKSNEEHKKDCYYLYNNYVYVCIADNKDSDFIEANYKKVGDELTLYDKQMIEEYIGLSQEELETINNLIEDDAIKVDKTHSSSKIYADIQQCLKDSKDYTLKEIAKKVGTNYKIVESEDKVTSTNCLYLVGNEANGYKIYAYVDKVPKKLSDSIITLEGYAKEEELTTHINNNVAHLTAEEQTIVGKLGDENGSLTYDTKTISTINDTQASDKETYSSNKINTLIQENKVAEINAEKVRMADNTTVEDNITGLKYSFNKGYKTLKCDFKNKKIDDTGAEVDSTTTIITDKLSLDEYKSVEISCTGKYKLMVFKYNADDSFNSKIANTVSSFTINVVKGCKYIIQFWKNGDTNLKDALLRTTIKGEIEADENAKNIIAEIYNEFNNGVRELLYNREPYYLATDYGISTENDNNSQALQALMDYVYSNGGGTILYPNGDYKYSITETTHNYAVCLKPGVSIVGEDKYLTRFIMNDCNGKAYSLFWRLIGANSPLANAHFEKFTVDGSALTTWGVEGKAFYAQYVKHCVFKDLYLEGTPATALGVDFLDAVTIDHVTCTDCGRLWPADNLPCISRWHGRNLHWLMFPTRTIRRCSHGTDGRGSAPSRPVMPTHILQ